MKGSEQMAGAASRAGFSLIEILGVIALIVLITTLMVGSFAQLVVAAEDKPIERVFREAVQEARIQAATEKQIVYLSYDEPSGEFEIALSGDIRSDEEEELTSYDIDSEEDELEVLFYQQLPTTSGVSYFRGEFSREPVPYVVFHPSGVSTPFQVLFKSGYEETRITMDPFSSGPMIEKDSQ